jgi:hypothetical protein
MSLPYTTAGKKQQCSSCKSNAETHTGCTYLGNIYTPSTLYQEDSRCHCADQCSFLKLLGCCVSLGDVCTQPPLYCPCFCLPLGYSTQAYNQQTSLTQVFWSSTRAMWTIQSGIMPCVITLLLKASALACSPGRPRSCVYDFRCRVGAELPDCWTPIWDTLQHTCSLSSYLCWELCMSDTCLPKIPILLFNWPRQ